MVTFARSVVDVPRRAAAVGAALGACPADWLADLVDQIGKASSDLLLGLGSAAAARRFPVREEVRVHSLILLHRDGPLLLPVSFVSSAPDAFFVTAEADLEATRQGSDHTRIQLSARFSTNSALARDRRAARWMIQDYTRRLGVGIADHLLDSAAV